MTIFIAGDSTAAAKQSDKRPETGWGEMLHRFLPEGTVVRNFALNGQSSKSFIDEGHLQALEGEMRKGDVLLVQFGHNDEKDDPLRHTNPFFSYQACLLQYIEAARRAGAVPVLLSSVARRIFDETDRIVPSHGKYPEAMRSLARGEGVAYIDIESLSTESLNRLGDNKSKKFFLWLEAGEHPNYPEGVQDNTHLNSLGAWLIASLIAEEAKSKKSELFLLTVT